MAWSAHWESHVQLNILRFVILKPKLLSDQLQHYSCYLNQAPMSCWDIMSGVDAQFFKVEVEKESWILVRHKRMIQRM